MNSPVFASLIPVVLFIAIGFLSGQQGWIRAGSVKDLSNLVFMVLTPALLFRTMSSVHLGDVDFAPIAAYFAAAGLVFGGTMALLGFTSLAAARALANMFSNTVMIGVPLVGLVFGEAGLVTLFTLISLHALILLTAATVVFELAAARERAGTPGHEGRSMLRTVLMAVRNGIIHPIPMPIIVGLLYAQTGLPIPLVIDKPLELLGQALGPLALLLVGVTLAFTTVGTHFRAAMRIALVKCLVHPVAMAAVGWAMGLKGMPLAVMVVAASLPVGANVFLFSQRYEVAQDEVTASVAVSTALALITMPVVIILVTRFLV